MEWPPQEGPKILGPSTCVESLCPAFLFSSWRLQGIQLGKEQISSIIIRKQKENGFPELQIQPFSGESEERGA